MRRSAPDTLVRLPVPGVVVPDDRAIREARGPRAVVDETRPIACSIEPEPLPGGVVENVATIFIANRECPFRCLMCDLWKHTTTRRVPEGAVAGQIRIALDELPWAPHVKLYNAGNFFDGQAIPGADLPAIATMLEDRRTVIVECHPRLVDDRCAAFARLLSPRLQVAMGLETVDPEVLPRLNKHMTLEDYERATRFLLNEGINVRAFILLRTPWQDEAAGVRWAQRSIDFAFDIGVECCVVIPTRPGNGIMDELAAQGAFAPPSLPSLETVVEHGLRLGRGRVLADLWDIERFVDCPTCDPRRVERLRRMNMKQAPPPPIDCPEHPGRRP